MPADAALAGLLADRQRQVVEGWPLEIVGIRALRTLKKLRDSALDRADLEALGPEPP